MAALSTQKVGLSGVAPTYNTAAAGGDTFLPTRRTYLHVKNGSGGSLTVTVASTSTTIGLAVADVSVSVPAGGERVIGPFPAQHFADSADGRADITYSGVTSLTVAVLELDNL